MSQRRDLLMACQVAAAVRLFITHELKQFRKRLDELERRLSKKAKTKRRAAMALNQTQGRALGGEPFDGEMLGTHIAKTIRGYVHSKVGALENRVTTSEADAQKAMRYLGYGRTTRIIKPELWSHTVALCGSV